MSLPVLAIATSHGCGHCTKMRFDGQPRDTNNRNADGSLMSPPIKGGQYWSPALFKALLTQGTNKGPAKLRVYEFFFPTRGPANTSDAIEINEFVLTSNGTLQRITYSPDPQTRGVQVGVDGGKKKPLLKSANKDADSFVNFVNNNYPNGLAKLIPHFPGWLFASGPIWDGAIKGSNPLIVYPTEDPLTFAMTVTNNNPLLNAKPREALPLPSQTVTMETLGRGCAKLGYRIVPLNG